MPQDLFDLLKTAYLLYHGHLHLKLVIQLMELFEWVVAVVLCALMTEREVVRSFWKIFERFAPWPLKYYFSGCGLDLYSYPSPSPRYWPRTVRSSSVMWSMTRTHTMYELEVMEIFKAP